MALKEGVINNFWHDAISLGMEARTVFSGPSWNPTAVTAYSIDLFLQYPEAKSALAQCAQLGQLGTDEGLCQALAAGSFTKAFMLRLEKLTTGVQFGDELVRALRPRMQVDDAALDAFKSVFHGKYLEGGSTVVLLWRHPDVLDIYLCPPGSHIEDFSQAESTITSDRLAQALWAHFFDLSSTPAPEAWKKWIENARALVCA